MPGVYISYPFCGQKCTYCNFASGVAAAGAEPAYIAALRTEIAAHAWVWTPDTVYIGGGTPSRLDPETLAAIVEDIPGRPWREATIEAAPGDITEARAASWRAMGFNRVSLGVQSFVEAELRATGRRHRAATVEHEVALLRAAGLDNFNLDLIVGLPHQTPQSFAVSLDWIGRLAPPHVSVYMLEVDEDSRLGSELLRHGTLYGAPRVPGEEEMATMYEAAVDRLAACGIARYEISNFARPGLESLHNLKYWRREPYAGLGADAHGFDGALRRQNAETAADYTRRIGESGNACVDETPAQDDERFFVGLRLTEGIVPTPEEWSRYREPIARFTAEGLLQSDGSALRLTRRGVLLSNEVFEEFVNS